MIRTIVFSTVFLALLGCGTQTTGEADLDAIRARLDMNACRINREELMFRLGELEFVNDSTYQALPVELLPDSLLYCPVTIEPYEFTREDGSRIIRCPAGHGETES